MPPETVSQGMIPCLRVLTPREREVVDWLAEGKSNWAIGQIPRVQQGDSEEASATGYRKLGVETRMEAANLLRSAAR